MKYSPCGVEEGLEEELSRLAGSIKDQLQFHSQECKMTLSSTYPGCRTATLSWHTLQGTNLL